MTASSQEYGSRKIWPKWQEKYCSTTDCTVADFFSTKLKPKVWLLGNLYCNCHKACLTGIIKLGPLNHVSGGTYQYHIVHYISMYEDKEKCP